MNNTPPRGSFSFAHALPGWQFFLLFVAAAATACGALASGFCAAPPGLNSRLLLGARVLFPVVLLLSPNLRHRLLQWAQWNTWLRRERPGSPTPSFPPPAASHMQAVRRAAAGPPAAESPLLDPGAARSDGLPPSDAPFWSGGYGTWVPLLDSCVAAHAHSRTHTLQPRIVALHLREALLKL